MLAIPYTNETLYNTQSGFTLMDVTDFISVKYAFYTHIYIVYYTIIIYNYISSLDTFYIRLISLRGCTYAYILYLISVLMLRCRDYWPEFFNFFIFLLQTLWCVVFVWHLFTKVTPPPLSITVHNSSTYHSL